jgi:hypothetical protein
LRKSKLLYVSFIGHHGTSAASAKEILRNNYHLSIGDDEWLGDGVYFFVLGLSSKTAELAEKWTIAQAWNKDEKALRYSEYCVMQAQIEVEEAHLLDLTTEEGVEVLNYLVDRFKDKIDTIGRKLRFYDGLLLNLARGEGLLPLEVVKGNFYIKFAKERIERIELRTSNCTVCTVYEPTKNIKSNAIIKTGLIT